MKQGLSLRVSQHLALTPQLQQSIRLLQLSTLELAQEVEQMLGDNPFLERDADAPDAELQLHLLREQASREREGGAVDSASANMHDSTPDSTGDSGNDSQASGPEDWEGDGSYEFNADDSEWGNEARSHSASSQANDDETDAASLSAEHISLAAHLHAQARTLRLNEIDRAALMFLIESLSDDGYLDDNLEDLAMSLGANSVEEVGETVQRFGFVLKFLRHMEPVGVGASNLAQCLQWQLQARLVAALSDEARAVHTSALAICQQPLEYLARRDTKSLMQLCKSSAEQVKAAYLLIGSLDPKPGRRFADVERNIITPDVIVAQTGKGSAARFSAQLNPDIMPRLKVHEMYANALKGGKTDSHAALQGRLQEARWFIKNIQQRFDTILRVSRAIVQRQHRFFTHGALAMRPLVLREIADELGLHESTISRVTTAKYMATPQGTFELKYFFGSALGTESGGNTSSTAVRALIAQLVAAENPKKPLSDNALADMLKEQGIACARRTVAKYREALRIAPTHLRKAL